MSPILVVLIAMTPVVLGAIMLQQFFFRREARRRKQEDITETARRERAVERERTKRVKRAARQDKVGDRIFWSLTDSWKQAGSTKGLQPRRISHNFGSAEDGSYYVEVGGDGRDPIDAIFWINVDLRRAGREVSVTGSLLGEKRHMELRQEDGVGFVCSTLADRVFGLATK